MKNFLILLALISPLTVQAFKVKLEKGELEKLKEGEQIERVEELKDEVFPKVTLISIIPHTPKENMRVFADFENHPKFIPGLLTAKIVKKNGNATDVAFEMHMPGPISNSEYTTRNFVETAGEDEILTWELVKSKQVKRTTGMVMFEAIESKTLFTYVTHITPDSSLAWVVKSRVVPDVKKNIEAVVNYLEKNAGKK